MKPSVHTESTFVIYDVKPATLDRNQFLKAVLDGCAEECQQAAGES
jgi:hypothetical protein